MNARIYSYMYVSDPNYADVYDSTASVSRCGRRAAMHERNKNARCLWLGSVLCSLLYSMLWDVYYALLVLGLTLMPRAFKMDVLRESSRVAL